MRKSKSPTIRTKYRIIRREMRNSGYHVYTLLPIAKHMARKLARKNREIRWVFAEPEGFLVVNFEEMDRINQARMKNNIKKMRSRDMNRIAIYRYPQKAWNF